MSKTTPDPTPDDVAADDGYVEKLRAGETPDDPLGQVLGEWRDEVQS